MLSIDSIGQIRLGFSEQNWIIRVRNVSYKQVSAQFSPGEFDGPEPDLLYRVGEQFYVLYELPLDRLGIEDEPHYIMYTGTGVIPEYEYKAQSVSQAMTHRLKLEPYLQKIGQQSQKII